MKLLNSEKRGLDEKADTIEAAEVNVPADALKSAATKLGIKAICQNRTEVLNLAAKQRESQTHSKVLH